VSTRTVLRWADDAGREDPKQRLIALGPEGRLRAYRDGDLSRSELTIWASTFPEEIPTVNGEVAWIALGLADLES
jgi:hypothetical protein